MAKAKNPVTKCVGCGCTDGNACLTFTPVQGGSIETACHWVAPGVCSRCIEITRAVITRLAVYEMAGQVRVTASHDAVEIEWRKKAKRKRKRK